MKKILILLALVVLTTSVFTQAPKKMSYQAVIRDAENNLVTNQQVGMQISILQDSATGTAVYVETQTPTSNANGLISIEIGTGTTSDDFSAIDWANGPYFIKTETDIAGGTDYTITGTSQLVSVPYAKYADKAGSVPSLEERLDSLESILISKANTNWLSATSGFFIDERDKQRYNFAAIGNQVWMTENLNCGDTIISTQIATDNDTIEKYAYNDNINNLGTYGGLYTWREMMQLPDTCETNTCQDLIITIHQGICPDGWHIPSQTEWQELIDYLGGNPAGAGGKLKETGISHWTPINAGATNSSGFTALPGGEKTGGFYINNGQTAYFGYAVEMDALNTSTYQLRYDSDLVNPGTVQKEVAFSVRCIKDE